MDEITRHHQLAEKLPGRASPCQGAPSATGYAGRPPRYDEVFFEGVAWLDRLAEEDDWCLAETAAEAEH